jgi:hypothetical protein
LRPELLSLRHKLVKGSLRPTSPFHNLSFCESTSYMFPGREEHGLLQPFIRLREEHRSKRRTIADALEILCQALGPDHAPCGYISLFPLVLPSGRGPMLVDVVFPDLGEAAALIANPGDCAVVVRSGVQRQLVMRCPDGCGEILSVNLDARSGKAWRIYQRRNRWSLFPSIDRPTGCHSHFILWHGHVLWCDFGGDDELHDVTPVETDRILPLLAAGPADYVRIADQLDEIPWDVLTACRRLMQAGQLVEGQRSRRGVFWIARSTASTESGSVGPGNRDTEG